jgi:hypothetical protein
VKPTTNFLPVLFLNVRIYIILNLELSQKMVILLAYRSEVVRSHPKRTVLPRTCPWTHGFPAAVAGYRGLIVSHKYMTCDSVMNNVGCTEKQL